jgi:methionyl-tRNA formyltransferase
MEFGLEVVEPATLTEMADRLRAEVPDVIVVAAFGLRLPDEILEIPRLGCVNVHPSLLPRWRGPAPIARAIKTGDAKTGVTIIRMDSWLDTGPILMRRQCDIEPEDTVETLTKRLSIMAAPLLLETLAGLEACTIIPIPQDDSVATWAYRV